MADTDRELLELAAKAVGEHPISLATSPYKSWDPLGDDGDALRLAVMLKIDFQVRNAATWVKCPDADGWPFLHHEVHGNDPYAATRRAIVRAAAEIGRAM